MERWTSGGRATSRQQRRGFKFKFDVRLHVYHGRLLLSLF